MRKNMRWMLLIALCLAVLVSCGKQEAAPAEPEQEAESVVVPEPVTEPVEEHIHESEAWDRNGKAHWQICACGETFGLEDHVLGADILCTVCGSEVWVYDDGSVCVSDHDETGECIRYTEYDMDGTVIFDERSEIEYDAAGNKAYAAVYQNGVLVRETEYENGTVRKDTEYFEDGTWGYNEYENDYQVYSATFTADDAMEVEQFFEYGETSDGWVYEAKKTVKFIGGETQVMERNEHGDVTAWIVYDVDGAVTSSTFSEFRYDDRGNILWQKTEYTGERVDETTYTYDEEGNRLLEELISTDGYRYTMEYRLNEDGWNYGALQTEILPDGTTIIMEFDEYGDTVSETHLRADGTEIPEEEW